MTRFFTVTLAADARGVATLCLARPEKHNAIDAAMIRELRKAVSELAADDKIRVVVLTAAGPTFCAGGDLRWMQDQMAKDRAGRIAEASELALVLRDLDRLGKPVIGRVQGPAYGGGVGLLCVCDIVIATGAAKFALTETRLGLIPATIGPYVVRRLGEGASRQVFFNSKPFGAQRAHELGLVSRVVTAADLDAEVDEEVAACLQCAPGAVADAKALCRELASNAGADTLTMTIERLVDRWESAEGKAGLDAFFARTPPPWQQK